MTPPATYKMDTESLLSHALTQANESKRENEQTDGDS